MRHPGKEKPPEQERLSGFYWVKGFPFRGTQNRACIDISIEDFQFLPTTNEQEKIIPETKENLRNKILQVKQKKKVVGVYLLNGTFKWRGEEWDWAAAALKLKPHCPRFIQYQLFTTYKGFLIKSRTRDLFSPAAVNFLPGTGYSVTFLFYFIYFWKKEISEFWSLFVNVSSPGGRIDLGLRNNVRMLRRMYGEGRITLYS